MSLKVRDRTTGTVYEVASTPAVDAVLSATSTNAIQNQAVYAALQEGRSIAEATDVELTTPSDGEVLTYDAATSKWVNGAGSVTIDELGDIADVNLSNLSDGQTIIWDATNSKWVNGAGGTTIDELNDIGDVDITTPAEGDVLAYDATNSEWVNKTLGTAAEADATSSVTESSTDVLTSGGAYTALAGKANSATTIAGYGITDAYTKTEVDAIAARAYKPSGTATLATLPSLTVSNLGNVYHMTEDFETTSDFLEGAGLAVEAGNDVGIVEASTGVYKYNVLGAFVDLSGKQDVLTAGYGIDIDANDEISAKTFVGTQAEWAALTPQEQAAFDTVNITDDFNGSNEIEVAYIETVPTHGIKDAIYGLVNYSYGYDDAADGFLDDVGLFTKTAGTGSAYTYTADSVEASLDGVTYKEFASLEWDGTDFTLTYADETTATVTVGTAFYWRTQTNVSYFAGREKNQTMNPLGGSGAGGSVIRVLTEDASLYGRSVTASGSLFTNSAVFSNTGEAIIEGVLETGEITIHLDNGVKTKNYQMTLDSYSYYELNVMMEFDYIQWLQKAGIDPTDYSSLEDVFDDEEAVRELMLKHASADFLAFNFAASVSELDLFTVNETAMKWIGLSDYLVDKLVKIEGAEDKLLASIYWKRYLKDNVPIMTSNTAPYGTASGSSVYSSSYAAWKVFTSESGAWAPVSGSSDNWIQYEFVNPICVKVVEIIPTRIDTGDPPNLKDFEIYGSKDGTNFVKIASDTYQYPSESEDQFFNISSNNDYYKVIRLKAIDVYTGGIGIRRLQFYGRSLDISVPIMTSNSAPYGTAYASSTYTDYDAYKAFDNNSSTYWCTATLGSITNQYIYYEFPHAIIPKFVKAEFSTGVITTCIFKFRGSNNLTTWTDLSDEITSTSGITLQLDNSNSYKYIALWIVTQTLSTNYACGRLSSFEVYGVSHSEKEFESGATKKWLYDHGVFLDNNSLDTTNYTYHTGSYGTAGTVTDFDDGTGFRILCTGTGTYYQKSAGLNNMVNVSNYSLLFMKNSMGGFIYPNTVLDVTSVNNQAYIGFSSVNNSGNNTILMAVASSKATMYNNAYAAYIPSGPSNIIIDVTELWLE